MPHQATNNPGVPAAVALIAEMGMPMPIDASESTKAVGLPSVGPPPSVRFRPGERREAVGHSCVHPSGDTLVHPIQEPLDQSRVVLRTQLTSYGQGRLEISTCRLVTGHRAIVRLPGWPLRSTKESETSRGRAFPGRHRAPRPPRQSCRPTASLHRQRPAGRPCRHRSN